MRATFQEAIDEVLFCPSREMSVSGRAQHLSSVLELFGFGRGGAYCADAVQTAASSLVNAAVVAAPTFAANLASRPAFVGPPSPPSPPDVAVVSPLCVFDAS